MIDTSYDAWPSGEPYEWSPAVRGDRPHDQHDFHVDLGCGKLKKGRIGVDRYFMPGVDVVMDLENLMVPPSLARAQGWRDGPREGPWRTPPGAQWYTIGRLPFPDGGVRSIISHHALEHIGPGFLRLMDECYRILEPGGLFRIIVPLFPSQSAVADPDHKRWFCEGTFEAFCGSPDGPFWSDGFSEPYTSARFEMLDEDISPYPMIGESTVVDVAALWARGGAREMRVMLRAVK